MFIFHVINGIILTYNYKKSSIIFLEGGILKNILIEYNLINKLEQE